MIVAAFVVGFVLGFAGGITLFVAVVRDHVRKHGDVFTPETCEACRSLLGKTGGPS